MLPIPGGFSIKHGVAVNDNEGIGAGARTNRNNIMGVELHDTKVVYSYYMCVCVCPGRSSATHATKRQTRHTHGLSILLATA